ncbi:hypothetical protein ACFVY4_02205 [Streptomyces sp. NPDC058299]|uniref:hypothetical protein n=1 Tax=Streptomyces sp. NPDC058299 TaxID=3346435 RepID=UPI0036EA32AC
MRRTIGALGALACLVTIAAVSGCSVNQTRHDSSRQRTRIHSLGDVNTPLLRYFPTAQEDSIVLKARSELTNQCLRHYGLPAQRPLTDPVSDMVRNPLPFYLSESSASKYGYRAATPKATPESPQGSISPRVLPPAERKAIDAVMNGWGNLPKKDALHSFRGRTVSKNGCIGESDARIMAHTTRPRINGGQKVTDSTQILNLILTLKSEATDRLERDPSYTAMIRSWASCVRKLGQPYATPADARGAAARMAPTASGGPSKKELHLGRQDAFCQQKVNYLGTVGYLTELYQRDVVNEYRKTLADVRKNIDQRVAAARRINDGAPRA